MNKTRNLMIALTDPYRIRHAISVSIAITLAYIVSIIFERGSSPWLIISALIISQTTRGTPLATAVRYFILILLSYLLAVILLFMLKDRMLVHAVLVVIFIVCAYLCFAIQPSASALYALIILPIVLLIKIFTPLASIDTLHDDLLQIVIGASIGMFCASFILPVRLYKEFAAGLLPTLLVCKMYMQKLTQYFLGRDVSLANLAATKLQLEKTMINQPGIYPEWIFEVGFNPGLRAGYRFFIIQLERMIEVLYGIHELAYQIIGADFSSPMQLAIRDAMQKNEELVEVLIVYFEDQAAKNVESDFTADITVLENALAEVTPANLQLLDMAPEFVSLTALVRDIKDIRELLLQLVMTLPSVIITKKS